MNEVDLIAGALAGGAVAGMQQVASASITDAYGELKRIVRRMLRRDPQAAKAIEGGERSPAVLSNLLESHSAELSANDVLAAAEAVWSAIERESAAFEPLSFHSSVRDEMAKLGKRVEELTQEQYRVLTMLRLEHRVLVSGAAGSGKTLVAVEKASRMSIDGDRVLFLCHNPLLAQHVRRLLLGTQVEVFDFTSWVRTPASLDDEHELAWSHYEEPVEEELITAYERLSVEPGYDAVVVDEGQDFRSEWWDLVELALIHPNLSTLYIFFDDAQALLRRDVSFPIRRPVVDLSRNCRNSGAVHRVLNRIMVGLPEADQALSSLGGFLCVAWEPHGGHALLEDAIQFMIADDVKDVVVLTEDPLPPEGIVIGLRPARPWLVELDSEVARILPYVRPGSRRTVRDMLKGVSGDSVPTRGDEALARSIRRVLRYELALAGQGTLVASAVGRSIRTARWRAEGDRTDTFGIRPHNHMLDEAAGEIPAYTIAEYKGLEAEGVIVWDRGARLLSPTDLYVAASRARSHLALLLRTEALRRNGLMDIIS